MNLGWAILDHSVSLNPGLSHEPCYLAICPHSFLAARSYDFGSHLECLGSMFPGGDATTMLGNPDPAFLVSPIAQPDMFTPESRA